MRGIGTKAAGLELRGLFYRPGTLKGLMAENVKRRLPVSSVRMHLSLLEHSPHGGCAHYMDTSYVINRDL
jgi:hypothetical protein